jgi:regulator of protease activity HflC (stomatin/prohibitin superfamily)
MAAAYPEFRAKAKTYGHRTRMFLRRNSLALYVSLLSLILAMMILAPNIFISVPAGHVGVLWLRFFGGTVTDRYYGEGMHMIFPWDELAIYDTRLQNNARMYDTISSNGLAMQVEIAVRYRLDRDSAGLMHKLVGPNYPEILVYPEIGSHARELISRYTPEQLYTETRAFIQSQILERMVTQLGSSLVSQNVRGKMLHIEDVLIRSIRLPQRVAEAIERKAEQQQIMLEYEFRLAREAKERDRKRIEAEGVRDFQAIVARTITNEYLRLRGIEATTALATSNNSKIIVIGGKDGLPVILNTADMQSEPSGKERREAAPSRPPANAPRAGNAAAGTGTREGAEIPKQRDLPIPAAPARSAAVAPATPVPVKD